MAAWPAPPGVHALQTTRDGACPALPSEPCWLEQVHGVTVVAPVAGQAGLIADAAVTTERGVVLAVRTADCVPVLLCARDGSVVGAAHAGWRGLAAGVLEATVAAMSRKPGAIIAWFGAHISQSAFEVGPEVRQAFVDVDTRAAAAFRRGRDDRWYADLSLLARQRLARVGVDEVFGAGLCTVAEPALFYSYRRARENGRMASLIWRN
ncbi:MAG: peptidoglycan editing factor PgeF [Gammaproteobacteria bacterium]